MKSRILLLFFVFLNLLASSQINRAKNWYFGTNNGLSFAGGSPTTVSGGQLTNTLGCAAISDLSGNLLFYTDGVTVFTSTNSVMANGTGLHGVDASQPAIILKQPGNSNLYYVFTVGSFSTAYGLKYSVVDMSLAGGQGSVTTKNVVIDNNCHDKLTAGKHCNGNDLWVVSTSTNSNYYFNYTSALLSNNGVTTMAVGTLTNVGLDVGIGQMKISPNSRKIGFVSYNTPYFGIGSVNWFIGDFDNATGQVSLTNTAFPYTFSQSGNLYWSFYTCGGEFSPNSEQFYLNSYMQTIWRIGLCDSSIATVPLQETTNQVDFGNKRQFQLAPDGKIYTARNGTNQVGAINNPNSASSTYTQIGISLGTNTCQWGLPNFPGFYFELKPPLAFTYTSNVSCMSVSFSTMPPCVKSGYVVSGWAWDFGDVASGTNNVSFLQNPFHTFSNAGSYSVKLIRYFQCNSSDTVVQTVNITQPNLSINSATTCYGTTSTVQVNGGAGPYSYLWSANTQTNSIANFTTSGIYSVTVSDQGAGNCIRTSTVAITVPTIIVNVVANPTILCPGSSTGQVTVAVTGGSGSYMYNYAQITQSSSVLFNLSAGLHSLSVSDFGFSCLLTNTFFIASAPLIYAQTFASPAQVCEGGSVALSIVALGGLGNLSYSWVPISSNASTIIISPLPGNYSYSVSVTDSLGCSQTLNRTFTVNPKPVLAVSNASACLGSIVSLSVSGANNYTWMPISVFGNVITRTATANQIFTVSGANNLNCINTSTVSLLVLSNPTVSAICNSPCEGQTVYFSANSAGAFLWQGPNSFLSNQQNPQIQTPTINQSGNYTLTITDLNGCSNKTTVSLTVKGSPPVNLLTFTTSICLGKSINISANGANTYTWMNGSNANPLVMTPVGNTIVQVSGTDTLSSCVASATLMITAKNCNLVDIKRENNEEESFKIYPNPNHGEFVIEAMRMANYSILDASGKMVMSGELNKSLNTIRINPPTKGTYVISIEFEGKQYLRKFAVE